jgi:hypothetical protein
MDVLLGLFKTFDYFSVQVWHHLSVVLPYTLPFHDPMTDNRQAMHVQLPTYAHSAMAMTASTANV